MNIFQKIPRIKTTLPVPGTTFPSAEYFARVCCRAFSALYWSRGWGGGGWRGGGGDIWCARCGPLCVCVQTIISASVCVRFDANARHRVGALIMVMTAQKRSCFSVFEKSHRFACCCVSRFAFFPCGIHVSVTLTTFSYARYALRPWVGLARRALDNNNARFRARARATRNTSIEWRSIWVDGGWWAWQLSFGLRWNAVWGRSLAHCHRHRIYAQITINRTHLPTLAHN